MFCKKGVFKNFAKFTGKHLCQENTWAHRKTLEFTRKHLSLIFNKVAGLRPVDIGWPVLDKKIILTRNWTIFSLLILPQILTGSFPPVIHVVWYKKWIENRYTCQNIQLFNKIPHDLPSHCKYLRVSLLIIKKKAIIFTADRKTPQYPRKIWKSLPEQGGKKVVSSWERENCFKNFLWRFLHAFAA